MVRGGMCFASNEHGFAFQWQNADHMHSASFENEKRGINDPYLNWGYCKLKLAYQCSDSCQKPNETP